MRTDRMRPPAAKLEGAKIAGSDSASVATTGPALTRTERADLQKVARLRARVARNQIGAREADLVAQMEAELSAIYPPNDPRWADITAEADEAVKAADARVAEACRVAGIPEEFRPSIGMGWRGRGANGSAERRSELRALGKAQITAAGKSAKSEIDHSELAALTAILADGLTSEAAQRFLASIPTPDELMQAPRVVELEQAREAENVDKRDWLRGIGGGLYV
jgi:hypothetical protein